MQKAPRPRLAASLRQLGLIATALAIASAPTPAAAEWPVIDAQTGTNTAQTVEQLKRQIEKIQEQLNEAKKLNAAIGNAGQLGIGNIYRLDEQWSRIGQTVCSFDRNMLWFPKLDMPKLQFGSLCEGKNFFRDSLTIPSVLNPSGKPTGAQATTITANAIPIIRNRQRSEVTEVALTNMSDATQAETSAQATIQQAKEFPTAVRAATTLQDRLAVLVDVNAAILTELAYLRLNNARQGHLAGAQALHDLPLAQGQSLEPRQ